MNNIINWIDGFTKGGSLSVLLFIPFSAILLFASIKLINYAEVIIKKTKFGGAFIGGVLIAAITSMPEMITEIIQSSSGFPGAGTADDIGSNAFSAFLIALSLVVFYKANILNKLNKFSKIFMLLSSILSFILSVFMLINKDVTIGNNPVIGIIPLILFILYLVMLVIQYKFDNTEEESTLPDKLKNISIKKAIIMFSLFSILIIGFALLVNWTAISMMKAWNLPQEGVGGIVLAIITSTPEIVAYLIFIKNKNATAGITTLLGSHFFNIGIAFFGDLAYSSNATFSVPSVGANWPIAMFTGIMMMILFLFTMFSQKIKSNFLKISIPSLTASIYIIGWILVIAL